MPSIIRCSRMGSAYRNPSRHHFIISINKRNVFRHELLLKEYGLHRSEYFIVNSEF